MRASPPGYKRKGRVLSLQIDFDAEQMLREMSPTRKSYGRVLSELIRRDYHWKQEWQRQRDQQHAALVEVGRDAE